MGAWNQPVVLQRQPTFFEQILPTATNFLTHYALMKMDQNWRSKEAEMAATREESTLQTLKESKPENVPEGMYAYWDGKSWSVTSKPTPKGKELKPGANFYWMFDPATGALKQTQAPVKKPTGLSLEERKQLETHKAGLKGKGEPTQEDLLSRSTTLRKEFSQQSKTFINVRDSFQRIQASVKDPSAAGDLALIFNFMKMLDPESVVREGEFATAQNAAGIPQRIRAMYNRIIEGERMAPAQRADFQKRAGMLFKRQQESHGLLRRQYEGLSKAYNVPSEQVLIDYRMPYEVDAVYEDENTGIKKKYLGDGKWETVK